MFNFYYHFTEFYFSVFVVFSWLVLVAIIFNVPQLDFTTFFVQFSCFIIFFFFIIIFVLQPLSIKIIEETWVCYFYVVVGGVSWGVRAIRSTALAGSVIVITRCFTTFFFMPVLITNLWYRKTITWLLLFVFVFLFIGFSSLFIFHADSCEFCTFLQNFLSEKAAHIFILPKLPFILWFTLFSGCLKMYFAWIFRFFLLFLFFLTTSFINMLYTVVGILLLVAIFTLCERKSMASTQRRKGPNRVGFYGVLQPITDGFKLVVKELIFPLSANFFVFIGSAIIPFIMAFSAWGVLSPSAAPETDISAAIPFILSFSSLGVYGIIFSGWASNSKYAFLGGLRAVAQMISYELVISFAYVFVALLSQSFSVAGIVYAQRFVWFIFPLLPIAVVFFVAALAETNRTPFDLPEAESELVAGYNVEYSGIMFAFFFLAEYANIALMSALFSICFLGGWLPFFVGSSFLVPGSFCFFVKIAFVASFFLWVRAALPRVRYDQLMHLSWKVLLPFEFMCLIFYLIFFFFCLA